MDTKCPASACGGSDYTSADGQASSLVGSACDLPPTLSFVSSRCQESSNGVAALDEVTLLHDVVTPPACSSTATRSENVVDAKADDTFVATDRNNNASGKCSCSADFTGLCMQVGYLQCSFFIQTGGAFSPPVAQCT